MKRSRLEGDRRAANDPSRVPSRRTADRPRGELDTGFGLSTRLLDKNIMTFNLQSRPLQGGCFVIPAFSRKGERWGAEHLCRRGAGRRDPWLRQPALQTWTRSLTCIRARSQGNTTFLITVRIQCSTGRSAFNAVNPDPVGSGTFFHLVGTVYGIIFSDPELDQARNRLRVCTNYGNKLQ